MIATLTSWFTRGFAVLGRISMYRLVVWTLGALAAVALVLSAISLALPEPLIVPTPLELIAAAIVLCVVSIAVDTAAQRMLHLHGRIESSLITAGILLFVVRPTLDPAGLGGIAIAAAVASLSKYVLVWRGRHVFNPAAAGAAALTFLSLAFPALGSPSWWVGTPAMAAPVVLAGIAVLWRTEKLRVAVVFLVVVFFVDWVRVTAAYQSLGVPIEAGQLVASVLWSSPFLFLGTVMLPEPLTQPPRRLQQLLVAIVVGVLAGWPIDLGVVSLGQERALLIGNLVAFAFSFRAAVKLTLESRRSLTPTIRELTFRTRRRVAFVPGQYLELDVPHRHPDARGTRREFSIASAPEDLPLLRVAFREAPASEGAALSSFKRALAQVDAGTDLAVTGVWGDFVLPARSTAPVLMVAAGIGITPFVSQLRHLRLTQQRRDIVLVYVASRAEELVFRDELEASGVPVVIFTRDEPEDLAPGWRWSHGVRLDAEGLLRVVPDIASRHAYISGPAGLIADLAPALERARSVTTDAFSGY